MKHNDSQYVHFSCLGWKKKSPDLPTHFFQTCYSKHTYFFLPNANKTRVKRNIGQNKEKKLNRRGFELIVASFEGHRINHWATT